MFPGRNLPQYLLLSWALSGCSSSGRGGYGTRDTGDPSATTADTSTPPSPSGEQSLDGTIRGPGGPLDEVRIQLDTTTSFRLATTDDLGHYAFTDLAGGVYTFRVFAPEASGLASVVLPLSLADTESRTLDLNLPALDPGSLLGDPVELELGEGLHVTVGTADLEPPTFSPPATVVAGVRVPESDWPPVDEPVTVLAVWYVDPLGHAAVGDGLPVRISDVLAPGTSCEIWVADTFEATWLRAGALTAGTDGVLVGDAALLLIGTVVLIEP